MNYLKIISMNGKTQLDFDLLDILQCSLQDNLDKNCNWILKIDYYDDIVLKGDKDTETCLINLNVLEISERTYLFNTESLIEFLRDVHQSIFLTLIGTNQDLKLLSDLDCRNIKILDLKSPKMNLDSSS